MPGDFGKMQAGNVFQEGDRLLCQDGHRRQRAGSSPEFLSERADCEVWGNFSAVAIHGQKGSENKVLSVHRSLVLTRLLCTWARTLTWWSPPRVFGNTRQVWVERKGKPGASWQEGDI